MSEIPRVALAGASGWLGRYVGPALLRARVTIPEYFTALNRSGPNGAYDDFPGVNWETAISELVMPPDIVILSVRPEDFRQGDFYCPQALVVSFMAGVTMAELTRRTGSRRIIRTMPNALVETRQSFTPWLASAAVSDAERALLVRLLRAVGTEAEVTDESALDILTALSGAGAAYSALLAAALMKAAVDQGLPGDLAEQAVENMICDAGGLLSGKIGQAPEMVQAYIDYAGVIAAGLSAAQEVGFEDAIERALNASVAQVRAMTPVST